MVYHPGEVKLELTTAIYSCSYLLHLLIDDKSGLSRYCREALHNLERIQMEISALSQKEVKELEIKFIEQRVKNLKKCTKIRGKNVRTN